MLTNSSKLKTKKRETQKRFHRHYIQDDHESKDDWQFTLIDQCTTMLSLEKESFIGNIVLKRSLQMALTLQRPGFLAKSNENCQEHSFIIM